MRFTTAWASVSSQNSVLRIVTISLSVCLILMGLALVRVSLRPPLLIERACYSKNISIQNNKRTDDEIKTFISLALEMRFNSEVKVNPDYMGKNELSFREREQDELKKKGMSQKIIVNSIKSDKGDFLVDGDRLFSVGKIRSVLPFPLKGKISSVERTEANPYGLILEKIEPYQDKSE